MLAHVDCGGGHNLVEMQACGRSSARNDPIKTGKVCQAQVFLCRKRVAIANDKHQIVLEQWIPHHASDRRVVETTDD
jgi:hypothetical protein